MSTTLLKAFFCNDARETIMKWASRAKNCCYSTGVFGVVVAGVGYVMVSKSGLIFGIIGIPTGIAIVCMGGGVAVGCHDMWRVADNTEHLMKANPLTRGYAAISSSALANSLVEKCIVLPAFKNQIKNSIDKAKVVVNEAKKKKEEISNIRTSVLQDVTNILSNIGS